MGKISNIKTVPMNIIFPLREKEVLLGIKTRKIGIGLFNGYGGKKEVSETMLESCVRELKEECGLITNRKEFHKVAIINLNKCNVYTISHFEGKPSNSLEMINPTWFSIQKLPITRMMADAKFWVPRVLIGKKIEINFHLNEKRNEFLREIHSKLLNE